MKTEKIVPVVLEEFKINVKVKLAFLWTSFMFLYIYVDYFHLYMPGTLNDLLRGRVFEFAISMTFLSIALVSVTIPALMIVASVMLSAKINRQINSALGTLYIPYTLFNLLGEAWPHMYVAAAAEVGLLCAIIGYAWRWPQCPSRESGVQTS